MVPTHFPRRRPMALLCSLSSVTIVPTVIGERHGISRERLNSSRTARHGNWPAFAHVPMPICPPVDKPPAFSGPILTHCPCKPPADSVHLGRPLFTTNGDFAAHQCSLDAAGIAFAFAAVRSLRGLESPLQYTRPAHTINSAVNSTVNIVICGN